MMEGYGAHGAKGGSLSRTSLATESMSSILGSLVADLGVESVLSVFIVESMKLTSQREGRIGIVDIADDSVSGGNIGVRRTRAEFSPHPNYSLFVSKTRP